ncbi:MAG: ribonuclease HII [bacterium]|nr:ribonuclease HII [bacterium]
MIRPTLAYEHRLWRDGFLHVAGIDEVGRGALAGPVVAAATVFSNGYIPKALKEVKDSKQLTETKRESLYGVITASCVSWGVGIVSHRIIDRINIANASLEAMQKAIDDLDIKPDHLLLDGHFSPSSLRKMLVCNLPHHCIVRGDQKVFSIAAASIIAKVTRDRLMRKLDRRFPNYGFARHKGYGTSLHYRALRLHGPCTIHRKTFYLGD